MKINHRALRKDTHRILLERLAATDERVKRLGQKDNREWSGKQKKALDDR